MVRIDDWMVAPVFEHIANRLGIPPEEAEQRCRDLFAQLMRETISGGRSDIPGLGAFVAGDSGIHFEPVPKLATVVNHRFAGLYPIPVDKIDDSSFDFEPSVAVPDIPIAPDLVMGEGAEPESTGNTASVAESADSSAVVPADANGSTDEAPPSDEEVETAEDDAQDIESVVYSPDVEDSERGIPGAITWARSSQVVESVRHELEAPQESDQAASHPDRSDTDIEASAPVESGQERESESESHSPPESAWNRPALSEPVNPNDEVDDDFLAESDFAKESEEEPDFGDSLVHPAASGTEAQSAGSSDHESADSEPTEEQSAVEQESTSVEGSAEHDGLPLPPIVVRRSGISRVYWWLIPVLIVSIGAVLWFLRESERAPISVDPASTPATVDTPPADPQETSASDSEIDAGDAGLSATSSADSSVQASAPVEEQAEPDPPPAPVWEPGTMDRRAGGYTLVVSSQSSRREVAEFARRMFARMGDESLPIDVLQGTAEGRSRYRVGVGQFESVEQALNEKDRLAPRLPEGVWVLRIRTSM